LSSVIGLADVML